MFKKQFNYNKLKLNLDLSIKRFDAILIRKKVSALKKRGQVIDYLQAGKKKKARFYAELVIPIDSAIEVATLLEQQCSLLMNQFHILEQSDFLELNLIHAICCIVWSAPYFDKDVSELQTVAYLLTVKYGKLYHNFNHKDAAFDNLNKKLMLLRSGVWISPKTIDSYLVQLTTYYENRVPQNSNTELLEPKESSAVGHKWMLSLRGSKPPKPPKPQNIRDSCDSKLLYRQHNTNPHSNVGKVAGYRRSSYGNFVSERPWTTLGPPGINTAPYRKSAILEVETRQTSSIIREKRRSNLSLFSMNSLRTQHESILTCKSTSSMSYSSSQTSVLAEEQYVSMLDNLFDVDRGLKGDVSLSENAQIGAIKPCKLPGGKFSNWGNSDTKEYIMC